MAQMGKKGMKLESLIADLKDPEEACELRLKIKKDDFRAYGNGVIAALEKYAAGRKGWKTADDNREGIRVYLDKDHGNGWFLLRLSVHDPIMPLNIESDSAGGTKKIAGELYSFLKNLDGLETDVVRNYIS